MDPLPGGQGYGTGTWGGDMGQSWAGELTQGSSGDARCHVGACRCPPYDRCPRSWDSTSRAGLDLVWSSGNREATARRGTAAAGHSWDLQHRVPVTGQPQGWRGNLPSHSGCCWKGGGQLEVLNRRMAGLSIPPVLPSINGATQLRN